MLYESQEVIIKLFNNYYSIASEAQHKAKYGKGLKILMIQRLPIVLAQAKADNTSGNLLNEIRKSYNLGIEQKKLLKKYIAI